MTIFVHGTELIESIGTTVSLKKSQEGRFYAHYFDEATQDFIKVDGVDATDTVVDAEAAVKMLFVAQTLEDSPNAPRPYQLKSRSERLPSINRAKIMEALGEKDGMIVLDLIGRFEYSPKSLNRFQRRMLAQVGFWSLGLTNYDRPLTETQIELLKNQREMSYEKFVELDFRPWTSSSKSLIRREIARSDVADAHAESAQTALETYAGY